MLQVAPLTLDGMADTTPWREAWQGLGLTGKGGMLDLQDLCRCLACCFVSDVIFTSVLGRQGGFGGFGSSMKCILPNVSRE